MGGSFLQISHVLLKGLCFSGMVSGQWEREKRVGEGGGAVWRLSFHALRGSNRNKAKTRSP